MSDDALIPDEAALAARKADLARQEAEIVAGIARRRRIRIAVAVTVPVLAALLGLGVVVVRRVRARAEVESLLDAIRTRGEPAGFAELQPTPVPDDENAAVALIEAHALFMKAEKMNRRPLARWKASQHSRRINNSPVTDEVRAELLAKAVAVHGDIILRVRAALTRAEFVAGRGPSLPSLGRLENAAKELGRLLSASALHAAGEGRKGEALADVARALDIAGRLCMAPDFWAVYRCQDIDADALAALRRIASSAGLPAKETREVIRALGAVSFPEVAERITIVAQVMMADTARHYLRYVLTPPSQLRECAAELRFAAEAMEAGRLSPRQVLARVRAAPCPPAGFGATLRSALGHACRAQAKRDVARVGLALELCRSANGKYPDTLDALAPGFLSDVPPDPFTGKPLVYVLRDKGFVVYSVNEDLVDDGGRRDPLNPSLLDIPWTGGEPPAGPGATE